jgi:hypothetical protein
MTVNFKKSTSSTESKPTKTSNISWFDFAYTGLAPMLIGKTMVLYFGVKYSAESGEGYGYGLAAGFVITAITFGRFLYKYRNYED